MNRIVQVILFAGLLILSNAVLAQSPVKNYSFASAASTYTAITGTNSTAVGDDGTQNGIPIGFNFSFGGRGVTHFGVSTNGFIKLGIGTTTIPADDYINSLTNAASPNPVYPCIAAFWDNNNRNTGSISYATTGVAGSRVLTVQWNAVNIGSGATSSSLTASFQIKLFEGTNVVKIIYSNTLDNAGAISASIGLNDATSFLSITPGATPNTSSTTANNSITDLTNVRGKEYTLTPATPLCAPVTSMTVSNITTSGAVLNITAAPGATGYRYWVSTTADYPASTTLSTSTTYTMSGLLSGTTYYVQAEVICSGGNGSAWYTTEFRTNCAASSPPYFQNFDSVTAPALVRCLSKEDLNGGASWNNTATSQAYSSPNCMVYGADPSIPGNDWFYTAPIFLTAGTSYRLSYYYKSQSGAAAEQMEVKFGTAANATAMTNTIVASTAISNTAYNVLERDFTVPSNGPYYLGFHNLSAANGQGLNIDDVRVIVTPSCGVPSLLNVSYTNGTSGIASWTAATTGTITGYEYAISTSATPPSSGTSTAGTSVNFSNLVSGQQYYLHVRTICTSNSAWATLSFMPPCVVRQVPYFENFDTAVVVPALPRCYALQDVNGGTTWANAASSPRSAPNCMQYSYSTSLPGDDWFFTPAIRLTAGLDYVLTYYTAAQSATFPEKLEVKYGTANNAAAMINNLTSTTVNSTAYVQVTKNFSPTVTGDYYFGFHSISDANQYYLFVDDIAVNASTECPAAPTPPVVTLTSDTTGTVEWGPPAGVTPTGYQYAMSLSSTPPASGTTIPYTSASFTATAGLRFFIHVRSVCANGNFSAWVTTTFITGCGAARAIPYSENFDDVSTPYLGNCMTVQDLNGGSTWKTEAFKPRSAPNVMIYNFDANQAGNDWAYTPGLSLINGVRYRLTFYYKGKGSNYTERFLVGYGGAALADSMTQIYSNLSNGDTTFRLAQVTFTAPRTGVFYIGFKAYSAANQSGLIIDDIKVDYEPGCGVPKNFRTTINSPSVATINWGPPYNGPAAGYEYYLSTNLQYPNNGTYTTDTSTFFIGLVPGTKYYISVRSSCGGNVYSSWLTDSLVIPCQPQTIPYTENFDGVTAPALAACIVREDLNGGTTWINTSFQPKSAPNSMAYKFNSAGPANDWFYTAPLQLTGGTSYRLSFAYKGRSPNSVEKLEVKYGTGNNVNSMANTIFADTAIRSTGYLLTQSEFTPAATGVYYIGFHAFSNANQFDLNVDDISVIATPTCSKPTNLSVLVTSNTTATATWAPAAAGTVTNYQYVISASSALPESGEIAIGPTASIIGLVPTQSYYLHVRTVCSGNQYSLWSTIPFTVPCQAYTLPYYENFDAALIPALPPCYTVENANGGNTWSTNEISYNSFQFSAYYVADAGRNADDWLYTPAFNFTAGVSYRLSFYYKAQSPDLTEKMEVKYGNGNNAGAMATLLMSDTNINFTTFRLYTVDFTPATTGAYNIGFHAISLKNRSYLFVDDIRVDVSPNCSNPVNLAVRSVTGSGGRATWSPSTRGIPTGYQYAITTSSADPTGAGTAVTDSFVTFSGLNPFTQYYFHVRTVCTNGISSWFNVPFYTLPNDEVCNALPLQLNGTQSCGSTVQATAVNDPALAFGCAAPNFTVWYKYTATTNGNVYLKTEIPVNNYPLYGAVGWYTLSGSCATPGALSLVPNTECRSFGQNGAGSVDVLPSPVLTAGTTYYIMISGVDYNSGEYCLSLLSTIPPACTNNVYPANQAQIDPVPGPQNDLTFRWRSVTGATGGYDLVLDSVYPPAPTAFRVHVADTFYKYTGITYNKNYFWYVVPKDNIGNSFGCSGNYSSFTTYNATNCRPVTNYGCSGGDSITYFSLKGESGTLISNRSGNTCGQDFSLGYFEYMNSPAATLQPDQWYSGFVKTGVGSNYVTIWIDFNDNGFFENSERLLNNLKAGPVSTLYSIMIPNTAPNGTHRLRIRNIYSDDKPTIPTHPCDYYDYSETEDYRVIIDNIGAAPRIAAPGSVGACQVTSATTIDAASNNLNSTVALLDSSNNLVAFVYPDGNTLGRVNSSLFVDGGAIRQKNGSYYLSRNVTITPELQPQNPYRFRMYFKTSELDALVATTASGVTGVNDLVLNKTSLNNCVSAIANYQNGDTTVLPYFTGTLNNGSAFVDVGELRSFSTFYLSGRHTYRFTGNGNWSNPANWENQVIPPANLPSKDVIIIDNAAGGQCILDVTQRVGSAANVVVNAGKRLVIPGVLRIQ